MIARCVRKGWGWWLALHLHEGKAPLPNLSPPARPVSHRAHPCAQHVRTLRLQAAWRVHGSVAQALFPVAKGSRVSRHMAQQLAGSFSPALCDGCCSVTGELGGASPDRTGVTASVITLSVFGIWLCASSEQPNRKSSQPGLALQRT